MLMGVGGFSKVVATFSHVGGSFNLFMATTGEVWIIPPFTLGQFWPSGIVVACVCVCMCVSVCPSIMVTKVMVVEFLFILMTLFPTES